ncbi:MAG: 16S rRNA (guanine(527)-N(7))-methyltransferase RsmG [Thiolinea sp.]
MQDTDWEQSLARLQCAPDAQQRQQLQAYLHLLQRWNRVYNLTAIRDPEQMLPLHVWDSLSVVAHVQAARCLDVGSGAGLPGIPLVIMRPEHHYVLLDTNGKKACLQQAAPELGLKNVEVAQQRVELWQPAQPFPAIISRAFASLADFVTVTAAHLQDDGILYAMKGRYPDTEVADLPMGWSVNRVHRLDVPGLEAERHLLELIRTA